MKGDNLITGPIGRAASWLTAAQATFASKATAHDITLISVSESLRLAKREIERAEVMIERQRKQQEAEANDDDNPQTHQG